MKLGRTLVFFSLGVAWTFGTILTVWAGWTPREFDQFYFTYPQQPQPDRLVEALDAFVGLTGTAAETMGSESNLRQVLSSRAMFFATAAEHHPEFWQHATSLFPRLPWRQKNVLLEIFKYAHEPGLAEKLNQWARSEEDDDRRLQLETVGLSLAQGESAREGALTWHDRWAVFFATGNTGVVSASWQALMGSDSEPQGNTLEAWVQTAWKQAAAESLELYSFVYPAIRAALQSEILRTPAGPLRDAWLEKTAWQDIRTGNDQLAEPLLPALEQAWKEKPENLDFYKGALAVLKGSESGVKTGIDRLEDREFFWTERLKAYQAYWLERRRERSLQWGAFEEGGEDYARKAAQYLSRLESFCISERLTRVPELQTGDTEILWREQVKNAKLPDQFKIWLDDGRQQSAGKLEEDRFQLWTNRTCQWTEVRDPGVHDRMLRGLTLNGWCDFLNQQTGVRFREAGSGGNRRVRLDMVSVQYDSAWIWSDAYGRILPRGEGPAQIRVSLDMDPQTGQVFSMVIEVPAPQERAFQIEKIFYQATSKP